MSRVISRRRTRLRRLGITVLVVAVAVVVLNLMDTQVRTPVGAEGVGKGSFPVVEIAGLGSRGTGFALLTRTLEKQGTPVLDFDTSKPGIQPLLYMPTSGRTHIPDLAVDVVLPAIRKALTEGGFDPDTQVVDVVSHSTGGLLMRYLIEHPVDGWDERVDDLVMVAVPNHGSLFVWLETHFGVFTGLGADMKPGSAFLREMGTTEPAGQTYTTIGGDPWELRWLRRGHHGFDDTVPAESPFMTGAANNTYPYFHGKLLKQPEVVDLIARTLAAH